jgi:hypothetical protein
MALLRFSSGPSRRDHTIRIGDLATDDRWPQYRQDTLDQTPIRCSAQKLSALKPSWLTDSSNDKMREADRRVRLQTARDAAHRGVPAIQAGANIKALQNMLATNQRG